MTLTLGNIAVTLYRGWGPDFEDEYAPDLMTGNVVKMIDDEGDTASVAVSKGR